MVTNVAGEMKNPGDRQPASLAVRIYWPLPKGSPFSRSRSRGLPGSFGCSLFGIVIRLAQWFSYVSNPWFYYCGV
jgi:hypothetical protein